jgi:hypothetical protein
MERSSVVVPMRTPGRELLVARKEDDGHGLFAGATLKFVRHGKTERCARRIVG